MKHLDKTVCLLIALLAMSIPVIAQTAATVPEAETPVYEDIFASLAAIVAGVPVIVEAIRGFWKDMPGWAGMALNWVLGIGICMFGWWQELGFLAGLDWPVALMYGIGAGIAASGFAETGLIQWLISLFARKKKKA